MRPTAELSASCYKNRRADRRTIGPSFAEASEGNFLSGAERKLVGAIGIAPIPSRLQRDVQTFYTTVPEIWHGRQVMLLHRAGLEAAALLVGHVRVVGVGGIAPLVADRSILRPPGYNRMTGTTPLNGGKWRIPTADSWMQARRDCISPISQNSTSSSNPVRRRSRGPSLAKSKRGTRVPELHRRKAVLRTAV